MRGYVEKRQPRGADGSGKVHWRVRYDADGQGLKNGPTFDFKKDANDWLDKVRGQVAQGTYVDEAQARTTVKDYAAQWRADRVRFHRHRPNTARRARMFFETHVDPLLGDLPMRDVKPSHLQNWLLAYSQGIEGGTFRTQAVYLKAIFDQAHANGELVRNPWNDVVKGTWRSILAHYPDKTPRPLPTLDEVRRMAEALPPHLAAAAWVAARTGLRHGELLGLCVGADGNVDLLRKTIRVDRQLLDTGIVREVKTKASLRTVPIDQGTVDIIAAHLAAYPALEDGRIFRSLPWGKAHGAAAARNGPLTQSAFNNTWIAARARAGVPSHVRLHDMREFYGAVLRQQGATYDLVDRMLGHKLRDEEARLISPVTAVYTRPLRPDEDDDRVRAMVAAFFDGAEAQEVAK